MTNSGVRAGVITGHGINADAELKEAFEFAGARALSLHIHDLIDEPGQLRDLHILGFPGGFSFGDHLGSGLVFAHLCSQHLKDPLERFILGGGLIIGICNGFQVLAKMGLLPNLEGRWTQEVSLIHNDTGVFEDSWVRVAFNGKSPCVWTKGLTEMEMPIRHGEGRFIAGSRETLGLLERENLIALTYKGRNPNGSEADIAGITDRTGRVFGLMPHPEAFLYPENHPRWTREKIAQAEGLKIFRNAVDWVKNYI